MGQVDKSSPDPVKSLSSSSAASPFLNFVFAGALARMRIVSYIDSL